MADNLNGVSTRQKPLDGAATSHVQRITTVAGDTLAPKIVSVDTTGVVVLTKNLNRVYAQILPRDGDLYIADTIAELAADTSRRRVKSGEVWDTQFYLGDIAIRAVTGNVSTDVEEVS